MGDRGPVPKDPEKRAGHRSKAEKEAHENVPVAGSVKPPAVKASWSQPAKDWYIGLRTSALADRYEPSDWALATYTCELMTAVAGDYTANASVLRVIQVNMASLLTSIADRRRMQLEVRRSALPSKGAANVAPIETAPSYDRDAVFG